MEALEVVRPITKEISSLAVLPLLAIVIPLVGAALVGLFGRREKLRNTLAVATTVSVLGIVIAMYGPTINGIEHGKHLYQGIEYSLKIMILGPNFKVDATSLLIASVTAFLWLLATIYAISYMSTEHKRTRFAVFSLLTLAADLGVLLSKDFFTLFIFFEMLGVLSTMLVIHEEDTKAKNAAKLYFWFCMVGGLVLLAGILLLYGYTGHINIEPMAEALNRISPAYLKYLITALMVIGFGAKAGIFGLHVWLPEAHPVAPTPASALLSGVMIKVGAYGILRTVNTLYAPAEEAVEKVAPIAEKAGHVVEEAVHWTSLTSLGYALIWIGVITMFFGVINALLSANCKRMLAYHSVSQMGYIIFGLGCAAYLGRDGAMGLAGSLYHIVNHALFKAALFLSVGAVYWRTHELDMYKLGGLWRNMPFTAVACLIAVLGISGAPLTNGFASKTLLHHSILEAFEFSAKYSATHRPDTLLLVAEAFFMLTAFGTFCSNIKMWLFVFIWKRPEKFKDTRPEPLTMKIALGTLSAAILFIGFRPNWLLEKFIGPALASFGFESSTHAYHIIYNAHAAEGALKSTIPILYNPKTLAVVSDTLAMHNILAYGLAVLGGGTYFVLGYRFGWFHYEPPEWFAVSFYYDKLQIAFVKTTQAVAGVYNFSTRVVAYVFGILAKGYNYAKLFLKRPYQQFLSALSALREGYTHAKVLIKRRYHGLIFALFVGYPRERERKIMEAIEDELEVEKRLMARQAVEDALHKMRGEKLPPHIRQQRLNEVRRAAQEMAESVSAEKLKAIRKAIHEVPAEWVVGAIAPAGEKTEVIRKSVADLASRLAEEGKDSAAILAELSDKVSEILARERFDLALDKSVQEYKLALEKYKKAEVNVVVKTRGWFQGIAQILIEILTEERVPWMVETRYSREQIVDMRRAIREYTRDMSLNVLVIIGIVVIFALLLFSGNYIK